jgi:hypothetical protein
VRWQDGHGTEVGEPREREGCDGHGLLGEFANSQAERGVRDELVEYGLLSDEAAPVRRPAGDSRNRRGDALGPTRHEEQARRARDDLYVLMGGSGAFVNEDDIG